MSPSLKTRGRVRIEGYEQLMKKLQAGNPIYRAPWANALKRSTELVRELSKRRAPGSGTIGGAIVSKMDARPVPLWGLVTMNSSAERNGFRYPFALQAGKGKKKQSGEHSVTHYRTGPRTGKKTRKWFSGSLGAARKRINQWLREAAQEIERAWGR